MGRDETSLQQKGVVILVLTQGSRSEMKARENQATTRRDASSSVRESPQDMISDRFCHLAIIKAYPTFFEGGGGKRWECWLYIWRRRIGIIFVRGLTMCTPPPSKVTGEEPYLVDSSDTVCPGKQRFVIFT